MFIDNEANHNLAQAQSFKDKVKALTESIAKLKNIKYARKSVDLTKMSCYAAIYECLKTGNWRHDDTQPSYDTYSQRLANLQTMVSMDDPDCGVDCGY